MTENFNLSEWITTKEAADLTGYAAAYFRQLIQRGRLPAQKLGRDWFLKKEEVLAYAAEMKRLGSKKYSPWRTGARKRSTDEEPGEESAE